MAWHQRIYRYLDDAEVPPEYEPVDQTNPTTNLQAEGLNEVHHDRICRISYSKFRTQFISSELANQPEELSKFIRQQALIPPRPYIRVKGSHTTKYANSPHILTHRVISSIRTVVDFDFKLDYSAYIMRHGTHGEGNKGFWVDPTDFRRLLITPELSVVQTGGILRQVVPQFGRAENEIYNRTLEDWARIYCKDRAWFKLFVLRREVENLEHGAVTRDLEDFIQQSLGYKGDLVIDFGTEDSTTEVWDSNIVVNQSRNSWLDYLLRIPILSYFLVEFFTLITHRYEVAFAKWPFGIYCQAKRPNGRPIRWKIHPVVNEHTMIERYKPAIRTGVLEGKRGWIEEQELLHSEVEWSAAQHGAEETLNDRRASSIRRHRRTRAYNWF